MMTTHLSKQLGNADRLFLFLYASLFASVFSSSSFLYDYYYPLDGTIFQIIGKGWNEGKLPYVDLWDQKGPYIYFINALGYWLTGNKYGLFILQILFILLSYVFLLKLYRKYFPSKISWLLLIVTSFSLSQLVVGCNVIELYELPFHVVAFLFIWSWAVEAKLKLTVHPPKYALLYGVVLGLCFSNRLTDAICVCMGAFCIFVYLLKNGQWKNIFHNVCVFFAGFLLVVLPCWIYFYVNDALYEMLYASILFNFDYKNHVFNEPANIYTVISTCLAYVSTYGLMILSMVLSVMDKKDKWYHLMWAFVPLVTGAYFMSTFRYEHYSIIAIPFFVIMTFEFDCLLKIVQPRRLISVMSKSCGIMVLLVLTVNFFYQSYQCLTHIKDEESVLQDNYDPAVFDIIGRNNQELLCYNVHPSIYLHNDITPCCRFFSLQDWYSYFSNSVTPKIVESIDESNAKYIMIRKSQDGTLIDNILEKKYEEVFVNGMNPSFALFTRK